MTMATTFVPVTVTVWAAKAPIISSVRACERIAACFLSLMSIRARPAFFNAAGTGQVCNIAKIAE